ncbi:hypothetical protein SAMN03159335_03729 [Burkholderia cepacia]|nr:hypothetical protein SAMN03159335_03729 [Burkholderia cepacia]
MQNRLSARTLRNRFHREFPACRHNAICRVRTTSSAWPMTFGAGEFKGERSLSGSSATTITRAARRRGHGCGARPLPACMSTCRCAARKAANKPDARTGSGPRAFALFEDIQRARHADDEGPTRRQRGNACVERGRIPEYEIQHDLEMAGRDPCERRLQVELVESQRLIQLLVRSHVTPARHLDERVERDVKRRHVRPLLERPGQAALPCTGRAVQYDGNGFHGDGRWARCPGCRVESGC